MHKNSIFCSKYNQFLDLFSLLSRHYSWGMLVLTWMILSLPYLHHNYFITHDGNHMYERVVELAFTFNHTPFGSRWLPHLAEGFGLPVFYFYPPLFFYLCAGFTVLGLSAAIAYKVTF